MPGRQQTPGRFKRWGIDIALPRWFVRSALVVVLLVGSLVAWSRWGEEVFDGDVEMSAYEAAQLIESRRHIWEVPEEEFVMDGGAAKVRHYGSDHCTLILWSMLIGRSQPTFTLHPDRQAEIAERPVIASIRLAGVKCPGPGPGCCLEPHPPPWEEKQEMIKTDTIRVWRYYETDQDVEGCYHYEDMHADGTAEPVVWKRCIH